MDNKTPLHHACEHGRIEILMYLIQETSCDVGESNGDNVVFKPDSLYSRPEDEC